MLQISISYTNTGCSDLVIHTVTSWVAIFRFIPSKLSNGAFSKDRQTKTNPVSTYIVYLFCRTLQIQSQFTFMTQSEILNVFNDSNSVKNIQYTLNGEKATLSLITSSKADSFQDLEECVRQALANTPSLLVKMLKDFPKPENDKDIEFYEKEIAKY